MPEEILSRKQLQELVRQGVLDQAKIEQASRDKGNRTLTETLLAAGILSEGEYLSFMSESFHLPIIDPRSLSFQRNALALIPEAFAKRTRVLPISVIGRVLTLAMANPNNLLALDDLARMTGLNLRLVIALPTLVDSSIERAYGELRGVEDSMSKIVGSHVQRKAEEERKPVSEAVLEHETPVTKIANVLIAEAIKRRASDLFLEPWEQVMRVRLRVDGVLEEISSPPLALLSSIVTRIKVICGLDIAEHRIPQDGRFKLREKNREVDCRVSILPTNHGEKVCIRLLDKLVQPKNLDLLGFSPEDLERIRRSASKPHGMILVTGPTGSGKSSTLYAVLNHLHSPEKNITTVEDPVEYVVDGINQVAVHETAGMTFTKALRSILRQDPDIIMIGEIRDGETMDIAVKAALTGHLVLSTLHTNDAPSSVTRMMNMGVEPFLIASSVLLISAQRLMRKLCNNCKEGYAAPGAVCRDLMLPEPIRLYKPGSCGRCRNMGYAGRTVISEVVVMTSDLKDLVTQRASGDVVKRKAREEGMHTLRESAVRKLCDGITSVEEVLRVTTADQEPAGKEAARVS